MSTSSSAPAVLVGQVVPRGRQSDVVYYDSGRDLVVLGTAGTGKTTMAVLRAKYLAHPACANHGPVLLVTYNNALARYLRHLVPGALGSVTVETYALFARGYLNSLGRMPGYGAILERQPLRALIAQAAADVLRTELLVGDPPRTRYEVAVELDDLGDALRPSELWMATDVGDQRPDLLGGCLDVDAVGDVNQGFHRGAPFVTAASPTAWRRRSTIRALRADREGSARQKAAAFGYVW